MDSVLVTLEEVTVCFSVEEWALLEEWQRELHREVTAATEQLLASLGRQQDELQVPMTAGFGVQCHN
uniref:KRAB domain-containing protein n=1 Tax=Phasianus colchicus TaxID=9054 RepID=A0A669QF87_PHACC